ncbi:MAG: PfkB family carbohydrate kinase [Phycisphaerae bacterium]|jgi:sugar/nucleoside kinase (ribokinase family)|nr:sugar kinase [Phycisphaerae bacterium]MCZ2399447.1 PfkB family carbohydrate kinase [Phycisphaerae bacterium]NUQ50967.1 sugar kinase [Phycisphaerae bacterium]
MSLLVTGSIALDSVETPHGSATDVLGGSAVYFSLAASLFAPVRMVGVVGEDFEPSLLDPLASRRIDVSGVEIRRGSRTFRWQGRYQGAMNDAETVDVQLNVLAERGATVPPAFMDSRCVFLANTHPALQLGFAQTLSKAELIVCDTMNLWIENEREALLRTLRAVHGLVLNEGEARLLTGKSNLVGAGREILTLGPRFAVIKKGEHGSLLVSHDDLFVAPAYPTERTIDPTGCGDTFAGAMMGYLAANRSYDRMALRRAMLHGSVTASFVIESFSIDALTRVTPEDVARRLRELRDIIRCD